jgi:hypothetical protein
MTGFPNAPRLLKGGIVLLDPLTAMVRRIIVLQYNPETISRTLQVQSAGGDGGDRSEALRLKGPPIETLKLDAEIDATDQLEVATAADPVLRVGIFPQLAALETMLYPATEMIVANHILASLGILEVLPVEAPLALFVWTPMRIVPVRITDFSVTEEAFDPNLNPIRAKVSLGMRVLSVNDLGFTHKGSFVYLAYQRAKEALALVGQGGSLAELGRGVLS